MTSPITLQQSQIEVGEHLGTLNYWNNSQSTLSPIHFAHANGFTAGTYQQMLGCLAQSRSVYALDHRATWQNSPQTPAPQFDWASAADDLIAGLDIIRERHLHASGQVGVPEKFIGVGHSLGAVMTLIAATRRPDLFEQIILIEPVLYPSASLHVLKAMPLALRYRYLKLAKRTLLRQDVWRDHHDFVQYHASKPAFDGISQGVMYDYARYGLKPHTDQSMAFVFPKTWEAHVFATIPNVWGYIKKLKVPCTCIRASDSERWVPLKSWDKWQKIRPDLPLLTLQGMGHLAPLQQPEKVADLIQSLLSQ